MGMMDCWQQSLLCFRQPCASAVWCINSRVLMNAIAHREQKEVATELAGIWKQEKKEDARLESGGLQSQIPPALSRSGAQPDGRSGAFGSRALRAALDSSPLWRAGRGEDTYNLVGHALRKVMSVIAAEREWELADVAKEAKAELVCGSSLKATLDCDWDRDEQKVQALSQVLTVLQTVEQW